MESSKTANANESGSMSVFGAIAATEAVTGTATLVTSGTHECTIKSAGILPNVSHRLTPTDPVCLTPTDNEAAIRSMADPSTTRMEAQS